MRTVLLSRPLQNKPSGARANAVAVWHGAHRADEDRLRMFEKPCQILLGRDALPLRRVPRDPLAVAPPYKSCAEED